MKKYAISAIVTVFAAIMLTACEGGGLETAETETVSETVSIVAEETTTSVTLQKTTVTTSETTEKTTAETTTTKAATVTETEVTVQTAKALTIIPADELTGEAKKIFEELNALRKNGGAGELIVTEELNKCAKILTDEFNILTLADAERADGSSYSTIFDDEGIIYTNCEIINGLTMYSGYEGVVNSICFSRSALSKINNAQWKYAGFYHNSDLFWTILLITDDGEAAVQTSSDYEEDSTVYVASYYDDSTAFAAFDTYMRALANDDYDTYLAITHQTDSSETAENFDSKKEGYVGMPLSDVEYYETELNPLISGYANYKVSEFNSSGGYKMDINTMGTAYGTVIVEKDRSTQNFYVATHYRYSPFINVN